VYIRDVSDKERDEEVHRIAEEVRNSGTEMLLLPETLSAARHALQMKWINNSQLSDVEEECKRDEEQQDKEK
ncbi:MAG TPA: hypothetical protein VGE66_03630, partial [Chitinophagaceae bacterium]